MAAPLVGIGLLGLLLLAHRLDVLGLGDDSAQVLGVDVRRTRVIAVVLAVLLAAISVAVTGPIGFVGLSAPVIPRLVARRGPGLSRHLPGNADVCAVPPRVQRSSLAIARCHDATMRSETEVLTTGSVVSADGTTIGFRRLGRG